MSTNEEYVLTDSDLIVSKTDLKGIITYINDDFIRIGGFSKQELIGAPHSILRHPDMPKAAFADMWKTLEAGNSWTGIVRNRRKEGGFYWVRANAMPLREDNKIVGYMSVRSKPTTAEIRAAEMLYRDLNMGKSKVKLDAGEVVQPGVITAIKRTFRDISVKTKLNTLVVGSVLSIGFLAFYGTYGLSVTRDVVEADMQAIENYNQNINLSREAQTEFKSQVHEFKNALLRGQNSDALLKYAKESDLHAQKVSKNLQSLQDAMNKLQQTQQAQMVADDIKTHENITNQYQKALKIYQVGNVDSVFTVDAMTAGLEKSFSEEMEKLVALNKNEIEHRQLKGLNSLDQIANQFKINTAWIGACIALVLLLWSVSTSRNIIERLHRAAKLIANVAEGKEISVNAYSKNELGRIMQAIKMLGVKMRFEAAEDRREAVEMRRIKLALDEVRLPVTLSNSQNEFIYMNNAAYKMWLGIGSEIAKRFPGFSVDGMYGGRLSQYFENDNDRTEFTTPSKEGKQMLINLGGRKFDLTVISVYDDRGIYVGRATQWKDITAELAMQQQISQIVEAASEGNFRNRVNVSEKEGFFRQLADGLNLLLGTCEQSYADIADIFDALSQGDLTHQITTQYNGEFETIKKNANDTVAKLTEIVQQIKTITSYVNNSSREIAQSSSNLANRTTQQAHSIEETAASMHELTSTVEANTENANNANDFVIGASNVASKGVNVIHQVVSTMENIHESSRKVVDIISVIDGISFQTNILALNAAVEAARAGEQGRGFAVVASEVRSLAQRAASAAGEIKNLINDSVGKIEDGSKLVVDAGHTMEDIVGSIRTVTNMIGQINSASNEQSAGISQASQSILEMEEMTQQNAILVEQSASISDNLKNQAAELAKAVNYFRVS
jgi:methyl-accepting chemotaxis protein